MGLKSRGLGLAKTAANAIGLEVTRKQSIFINRFLTALSKREITHVVDVGANIGQFGLDLYASGFKGRLLSFEPQKRAHAELRKSAKSSGQDWTVTRPVALTDTRGMAVMQNFEADAMSSLMVPSGLMEQAVPNSSIVGSESVECVRLDEILSDHWSDQQPFALKIDVQGAEKNVLEGATGVLDMAKIVQVELSIRPLYEGQPSYHEMDVVLRGFGYHLVDLSNGYRNPKSGDLVEYDAIYARG